jgi:hypothetical protein
MTKPQTFTVAFCIVFGTLFPIMVMLYAPTPQDWGPAIGVLNMALFYHFAARIQFRSVEDRLRRLQLELQRRDQPMPTGHEP